MRNLVPPTVRLVLAVALCIGFQTVGSAAAAEERPLTNEDVVKMVRAGLAEDTVLAKIQGARSAFDTSVDGLIALKQAGVSDRVVRAMVAGGAPAAAPAAASGLDPGLYLDEDGRLTRLEPVQYAVKMGTFSYRFEVRGPRAGLRASGRPTFVLSLANAVGGLAMTGPAQFVLVRLDAKSDKRELKLDKKEQPSDVGLGFTYADRGGRRYEMKPKVPLGPGQYAFVLGGEGLASQVGAATLFDFEVGGGQAQR